MRGTASSTCSGTPVRFWRQAGPIDAVGAGRGRAAFRRAPAGFGIGVTRTGSRVGLTTLTDQAGRAHDPRHPTAAMRLLRDGQLVAQFRSGHVDGDVRAALPLLAWSTRPG